jgi:hypothetical protein
MPPGDSAQLRRQSTRKRKEFDPKVELRTVDPKSRAKTHALANVVDGIYRRINDSATSERIHKIGVLPAQCSGARMPSQSLTPAVDL